MTIRIPFTIGLINTLLLMTFLTGCTSNPPLPTPAHVDLDRFMGTWFVIGYTPILVDKEAHNAVEHYFLSPEGRIQTTYQFRDGGFSGKLKTYTPVGTVYNHETNAEWRMQFIWPFKAEYTILHLSDSYETTIIAHSNRKYAWIMHRSPVFQEAAYEEMLQILEANGFDRAIIKRLPQEWGTDRKRLEIIQRLGSRQPLSQIKQD